MNGYGRWCEWLCKVDARWLKLALMEPDRSVHSTASLPDYVVDINAIPNEVPSFSGVDASSSLRSSRRQSRSTRISERESLEEEIKRTVKTLRAQVDTERRRADNAERKVREMAAHLKAVNDARLEALRDAGRAKEELRLYKIQLDAAQSEIYRAQDVIIQVDRQRHSAEKEAAKNRTKARQLNETILIQTAREEAYRLGMKEGLERGRDFALAEAPHTPYDEEEEGEDYSVDESRSSSPQSDHAYEPPRPRSMVAPSQHSARSRPHPSPSPIPVPLPQDVLPVNPPTAQASVAAPSMRAPSTYVPSIRAPSVRASSVRDPSMRVPSPNPLPAMAASSSRPPSMRQPSPQSTVVDPPANWYASRHASSINLAEQMGRPVSVRTITPAPQHPAVDIPPDNFIPVLDADMRIRLPPPHEFATRSQSPVPPPASESSVTSQEPLPIAPRTHTAQQRTGRHRRNSSSGSSSLSQLDIINKPYTAGLRTPMSAIEEVNSQTASPNTQQSMHHQRSFSENSMQPNTRPPSIYGGDTHSQHRPASRASHAGSQWSQPPGLSHGYGGDAQSQPRPSSRASHAGSYNQSAGPSQHRPTSRASYAGSWSQQQGPPQDDRRSDRRSEASRDDAPSISIQPPSLSNKTESMRGGTSAFGVSPVPSQGGHLPSVYQSSEAGPSQSHGQLSGMPGEFTTDYYAQVTPSRPSSTEPPVIPNVAPLHYQPRSQHGHSVYGDNDEVSSQLSAETLTTPPTKEKIAEWAAMGWHLPGPTIGVHIGPDYASLSRKLKRQAG
ncbi:hypothetical protein BDN70DRAFT_854970 [Pholiota conissans]|uniref:Uncharacterized protein n=1 Tax=Pholiota conissans TaxID=109636 RepID=A0A9P5Z6M2_9AGAR|nr:hypothetical protein BDN70DRAFT_854970 [Pholiota conissans]